jgi:hypothetical protein
MPKVLIVPWKSEGIKHASRQALHKSLSHAALGALYNDSNVGYLLSGEEFAGYMREQQVTSNIIMSSIWIALTLLALWGESVLALITSVLAGSVLVELWEALSDCPEDSEQPTLLPAMFALTGTEPSLGRMTCAVVSAIGVQASMLTLATGHVVPAVIAAGLTSALVSYSMIVRERLSDPDQSHWKSITAFVSALVLATVFVGGGGGYSFSLFRFNGTGLVPPSESDVKGAGEPLTGNSRYKGLVHQGILFWPESTSVTKLVVPPSLRSGGQSGNAPAEPLNIPFAGVYWLFRHPDAAPPPLAVSLNGDLAKMRFTATDSTRLIMEAHQNLGKFIEASCCKEIQILIRNRDRIPETISLELFLVNTEEKRRLSLGRDLVKSSVWIGSEGDSEKHETLNFSLSKRQAFNRFDELVVNFVLSRVRHSMGARVAIDRFVLVART